MLHRILSILVIILVIVDFIILLGTFNVPGISDIISINIPLYMTLVCIQIPIVYFIIYKSYISPIEKLNQGIARFYTDIDAEPKIPEDSWSKWMQNVIIFFKKSLQILKVFKSELRDGRQLRSEVEIAAEIQKQALFQTKNSIPKLDVAVGICSASEVWWDSWDIVEWQNGNFYLYVGDVTGHGVASGFVMMMVNALISAFAAKSISGAEILSSTNAILKPRIKQNMMMTTVMLRWDSVNGKIYYTGAGHEFILVYKSREKKIYKVKTWGIAIGMMKNISSILKEQQISFESGDLIILYTDGITEARYRSEQNGMLFWVERIIEAVMKLAYPNPETVFRQITLDLSAFMWYNHKQYDDITLAVIGFTPEWKESHIQTDIHTKIDSTNITEWNWDIHKI